MSANKKNSLCSSRFKKPLGPPCLCGEKIRGEERGAALVVAIGVLTVLLAISITFFQISREQLRSATNVSNRVKADFLVDGAFSVAIAFLNQDRNLHPNYTSLDHAWRTYFNGAWAAGKPWMWTRPDGSGWNPTMQNNIEPGTGLPRDDDRDGIPNEPNEGSFFDQNNPAPPEVNLIRAGLRNANGIADPNGVSMFRSPARHQWLYIPRVDPAPDFSNSPSINPLFATAFPLLTGPQLRALTPFAIEDDPIVGRNPFLNERGADPLNDDPFATAIPNWLTPTNVPQVMINSSAPDHPTGMTTVRNLYERLNLPFNQTGYILSRAEQVHTWADVDNNGDGLNDSVWLPVGADLFLDADGLDNDLDGEIDELGEPALFVYRARGTTRPLGQPVNLDAFGMNEQYGTDHQIFRTVVTPFYTAGGNPVNIQTSDAGLVNIGGGRTLRSAIPDEIDNDYTLMVDDGLDVTHLVARALVNDLRNVFGITRIVAEPCTELAGRMAILINDEASKVNLNAAGGTQYEEFPNLQPPGRIEASYDEVALRPALAEALTPAEYQLSTLPWFDEVRHQRVDQFRNGAPDGVAGLPMADREFSGPNSDLTADEIGRVNNLAADGYHLDVTFPGYGRVDDNGNLLWMSLNGLDDDGDGLIDEGVNPAYPELLGLFEGIDEPGEYRTYRPFRHRIAEGVDPVFPNSNTFDDFDNDEDDVTNEIGELGDRVFRTHEQLKITLAYDFENLPPWVFQFSNAPLPALGGISPRQLIINERFNTLNVYNDLRNLVGVHSSAKNERHYFSSAARGAINGPTGGASSELRRQFQNVSGPKLDYNYALAREIADAFRLDNDFDPYHWRWTVNPITTAVASRVPRFLPFNLDPNDSYTPAFPPPHPVEFVASAFALGLRLSGMHYRLPEGSDGILSRNPFEAAYVNLPYSLSLRADEELRALQLATNTRDFADADFGRAELTAYTVDTWWDGLLLAAGQLPVGRNIEYTVAGIEAIRINEIMVRPVRRIEAEMDNNPLVPAFNPRPIPAFPAFETPALVPTLQTYDWDDFPPQGGGASNWNPFGTVLGSGAGFSSAAVPGGQSFEMEFTATEGLPAGNYYIVINTQDENGNPTITPANAGSFSYSIKYRSTAGVRFGDDPLLGVGGGQGQFESGVGRILEDIGNAPLLEADVYVPLSSNYVNDNGFVFLPNVYNTVAPIGYFEGGGAFDPDPVSPTFNPFGEAFTVRIPSNTDVTLNIAIRRNAPLPLSINFIEFSQEPDHEWVELVNVSDTAVNLSDWELEISGHENGFPLIATIPDGTAIAGGGKILLGVNKFDDFQGQYTPPVPVAVPGGFYNNGIGLARGTLPQIAGVTIPPGGSNIYENVTVPEFSGNASLPFRPATQQDEGELTAADINLVQSSAPSGRFSGLDEGAVGPNGESLPNNKPWDRIVQLEIPDIASATGAGGIADWILRGGIFPNYPEQDNIDSDGDNIYISFDGIDNNFSGVPDDVDAGGDPIEGIDEGRFRILNPAAQLFSAVSLPVVTDFVDFDPTSPNYPLYFGQATNPPEWKEFVERRLFPGDNVIVTLYDGPVENGRVVDRVTYTQQDVENAAVDDLIVPDFDLTVLGLERFVLDPAYQNFWAPNEMGLDFYRTLERRHPFYIGDRFGTRNRWQATDGNYDDWAPSISRYIADASNNPIARDAAFEDYFNGSPLAENLQATLIDANPVHGWKLAWNDGLRVPRVINRPLGTAADAAVVPEFSYAIDLQETTVHAADEINYSNIHPDDATTPAELADAADANVATVIPGDVPTPATLVGQNVSVANNNPLNDVLGVIGTVAVDTDGTILSQSLNYAEDLRIVAESAAQDPIVLTAAQAELVNVRPTPGDAGNLGLSNASAMVSWNALGAGRAPAAWTPVYLYYFDSGTFGGIDPPSVFYRAAGNLGGGGWSPIALNFVPTLLNHYLDASPFNGMFNNTKYLPGLNGGALQAEYLGARWPLEDRVAFYATQNQENFIDIGAQADSFFIWGPEDGLENGEYLLYVVTRSNFENLAGLGAQNIQLLSPFADDVLFGAGGFGSASHQPGELIYDITVFTDLNNDLQMVNRDSGIAQADDGIAAHAGVQADANGVMPFGHVVRVANNRLAVRLVNQSPTTNWATFSHIVLAPRKRTPGRINLNTAVTTHIPTETPNERRLHHPLMGVPGMLLNDVGTYADVPGANPPLEFSTSRTSPNMEDFFEYLVAIANSTFTTPSNPFADFAPLVANPLGDEGESVFFRAWQTGRLRTVHADGRYYEFPSDLVRDRSRNGELTQNMVRPFFGSVDPTVFEPVLDPNIDTRAQQFQVLGDRFRRMANLVTTRSDVFEILVTVQAGYGVDENNDGRINYRGQEFIPTSEQTARMVYER